MLWFAFGSAVCRAFFMEDNISNVCSVCADMDPSCVPRLPCFASIRLTKLQFLNSCRFVCILHHQSVSWAFSFQPIEPNSLVCKLRSVTAAPNRKQRHTLTENSAMLPLALSNRRQPETIRLYQRLHQHTGRTPVPWQLQSAVSTCPCRPHQSCFNRLSPPSSAMRARVVKSSVSPANCSRL